MSFLSDDAARSIRAEHGTPVYVYDAATLRRQARALKAFPAPYGFTARFAMKALPTAAVLRILSEEGLHIDAGSGYEAERAMRAGIAPDHIQITAQQLPHDFDGIIAKGVRFTACSVHQLREYGKRFPNTSVGVRINPGLGSGHSNRTNVGGPSSSFGIWHEHLPEVLATAKEFGLTIGVMHTHIGSGGDPEVWKRCAAMSLGIAAKLPDAHTLSLGGGFKVARMEGETSANLLEIGEEVKGLFEDFAKEHGRELHLELEPGTFIAANAGAIVTTVIDVVDTGAEGYRFIKIDSGMTELLRPALYGAQHPMWVVPTDAAAQRGTGDYLIAGHCCESGDILTPEPGNPEGLKPRTVTEPIVGDVLVIGGAGAYCSGLQGKNYNSFPEAPEVLLEEDGALRLIRKRQTMDQFLANEL